MTIEQVTVYDGRKNGKANESGYKLQVKTSRRAKGKPNDISMKYQFSIEFKKVRML